MGKVVSLLKKSLQRKTGNVLSYLGSGMLVALGQPALVREFCPVVACLGFAWHWYALKRYTFKQAKWYAFWWFLCVQLVQLSWMTSIEYQGVWILGVYGLLAFGMSLQWTFLLRYVRLMQEMRSLRTCLLLASLWTIAEWMRLFFFCGFAWNFVGVTLSWHMTSLQCASLFGVLGMSFFVVFTNSLFFYSKRVWLGVALLPYLFGVMRLCTVNDTNDVYRTLLVQTGLFPEQKECLPGRECHVLNLYEQWERVLAFIKPYRHEKLDYLVFPETVFPYRADALVYEKTRVEQMFCDYLGKETCVYFSSLETSVLSHMDVLQVLALYLRATVIAGLCSYEQEHHYNSLFVFRESGWMRYDKRILLPLAEMLPCEWLQPLSRLYGITSFFTKGMGPQVIDGILPSICYEELFSHLFVKGCKQGGLLCVNITNDGWYPKSVLAEQHFTQGLLRAVEIGRPLVRACHTGITAGVDALGRLVRRLEACEGALVVCVPKQIYITLFSFYGDLPLLVFCFCVFGNYLFYKNRYCNCLSYSI